MQSANFLIIGGGVAGLSAAAALSAHGAVAVIEAEEALGYHSSGRSVTFSHYGIGNDVVRGLTAFSRGFFQQPADLESAIPIAALAPALFVATEPMEAALDALEGAMAQFSPSLERMDDAGMRRLFPPLRIGEDAIIAGVADHGGLRIDADLLLHSYAHSVRTNGGVISTAVRIDAIRRENGHWHVSSADRTWRAPILINAAGAWADQIAVLAGVQPLGLQAKRRTIIVVDGPVGADVGGWAFLKTVVDDFYMMPSGGKLLASPVDEAPSEPCDAQPEEYDIALAAARTEQYTRLEVRRIGHSWAGLRTFTADRVPTAGFAPDAPGFFWLAGQGGYGLQTAPAMAQIVAALIIGGPWPTGLADQGVTPDKILPDRFAVQPNESASVRMGWPKGS